MWHIWLIIAGAFVILEIATMGFLVFWFAVGALAAMVVSFFIESILIQSIVFVIVSTILLFATKPFVNKVMPKDFRNLMRQKCASEKILNLQKIEFDRREAFPEIR